ncbi:MAG: Rnf-Nqr domain containing protein [Anaerotruncus massiliensis (ex Togo et al. 2019)]
MPLILPISPEVADSLGIYVPILSINTILLTLCARYERPADRPVMALVDAAAYSLGFALAMCLIAFFRELLGAGSLWWVPVPLPFKAEGVNRVRGLYRRRAAQRARAVFAARGARLFLPAAQSQTGITGPPVFYGGNP